VGGYFPPGVGDRGGGNGVDARGRLLYRRAKRGGPDWIAPAVERMFGWTGASVPGPLRRGAAGSSGLEGEVPSGFDSQGLGALVGRTQSRCEPS